MQLSLLGSVIVMIVLFVCLVICLEDDLQVQSRKRKRGEKGVAVRKAETVKTDFMLSNPPSPKEQQMARKLADDTLKSYKIQEMMRKLIDVKASTSRTMEEDVKEPTNLPKAWSKSKGHGRKKQKGFKHRRGRVKRARLRKRAPCEVAEVAKISTGMGKAPEVKQKESSRKRKTVERIARTASEKSLRKKSGVDRMKDAQNYDDYNNDDNDDDDNDDDDDDDGDGDGDGNRSKDESTRARSIRQSFNDSFTEAIVGGRRKYGSYRSDATNDARNADYMSDSLLPLTMQPNTIDDTNSLRAGEEESLNVVLPTVEQSPLSSSEHGNSMSYNYLPNAFDEKKSLSVKAKDVNFPFNVGPSRNLKERERERWTYVDSMPDYVRKEKSGEYYDRRFGNERSIDQPLQNILYVTATPKEFEPVDRMLYPSQVGRKNGRIAQALRRHSAKDFEDYSLDSKGEDQFATVYAMPRKDLPNEYPAVETSEERASHEIAETVNETREVAAEILNRIVDELEEMKANDSKNKKNEGMPCRLSGSWVTSKAGVRIDMRVTNDSISVNLTNLIPQVAYNGILNTTWNITGFAPFKRGGPFSLIANDNHTKSLAVFVGSCRVCQGIDTIQGVWSVAHQPKDCRTFQIATSMFNDVFRRTRLFSATEKKSEKTNEVANLTSITSESSAQEEASKN